jgi:hypothetical protein
MAANYAGMPTTYPYPTAPQYPLAPQQAAANVPAYGLAGANAALAMNPGAVGGQRADYSQINANRNMAMQQGRQGINAVQGYNQQGQQASQLQAALSGALGAPAQAQAFANFQASPGQQWLQDQALRGVTRNAAAIGGLGGGNVMQALQRQAMGMAQQDFQNQFANMGAVADRGIQAAQLQNALYQGNQNAATSAGAQGAGVQGSVIGANAGRQAASIAAQAALARDRGQYAFQAGQDIGANLNATTSALANLANQQGAGMSGYVRQLHREHCQPAGGWWRAAGAIEPESRGAVGQYCNRVHVAVCAGFAGGACAATTGNAWRIGAGRAGRRTWLVWRCGNGVL